ncbi:MFS transporter [Catenulispora rubra]|uniref:MFS transporter n=1 Tax=Catenulispora rubra TaxID=280293 RepID=UPI002B26C37E|nr:MFS transporter [Catenulispora rubra]
MAPTRRLWLAVLCGYLALGATLQELPPFLASKFHVGPAATGLVVGAAFAATAAGRPFAGRWGDTGHSRTVVVAGGLLAASAGAGTVFAPNIAALLLCRLVMGAGEAALFSGALPWVLADAPPDQRGRVAGWFGLSMWGGLTLGPVLAAGIGEAADADAVWWTVAVLPLVSVVLASTATARATEPEPATAAPAPTAATAPAPESAPELEPAASTAPTGPATGLVTEPIALMPAVATAMAAASPPATAPIVPAQISKTPTAPAPTAPGFAPTAPPTVPKPRAQNRLIPPGVALPGSIIGLAAYGYGTLAALLVLSLGHSAGRVVALPVFACAFLVVRGFGSPLVDRHGGAAVARVTLVVQAAGLVLLAAAPDLVVTLVGAAVTGAGLGLIYPATAAMTLQQARSASAGAAVGAMTSFWDLGILVAGPLGGSIAAGAGYRAAFAAAVVATVIALVLAVRTSLQSRMPTARE